MCGSENLMILFMFPHKSCKFQPAQSLSPSHGQKSSHISSFKKRRHEHQWYGIQFHFQVPISYILFYRLKLTFQFLTQ